MGKFLDNCDEYAKARSAACNMGYGYYNQFGGITVSNRTNANGTNVNVRTNNSFLISSMLMNGITTLTYAGINAFGNSSDGKGAKVTDDVDIEDVEELDEETQEKIKAKENERDSLYKNASVRDSNGLKKAISTKETEINTLSNDLAELGGSSKDIQAKINEMEAIAPNERTSTYANDLATLKANKSKAEQLEKLIEQTQVELLELNTIAGQAEEINREIAALKNDSTDVDYNVEQEKDDIKTFMDALKEFKDKPDKTTATALHNAYKESAENKEAGIQNKTIKKAYELVKTRVEDLMTQEDEPNPIVLKPGANINAFFNN